MTRPGPFTDEEWIPGQETINSLEESKVLSVRLSFGAAKDSADFLQCDVRRNSLLRLRFPPLTAYSGAGGLGCEILKNLALSGFKNIHVIDMGQFSIRYCPCDFLTLPDTIDVSNLNRQFLFREADVGKSKAECAAAFVEKRVKGVKITPYNGKIQDKDEDYYMQFKFVVCGLDSIEARRWINATLVGMVDDENAESLKPLIDGGTEGRHGRGALPSSHG